MTKYTYAVLGAGLQGSACAYDMAQFGDAKEIRLGDVSLSVAKAAAQKVNRLIGRRVARAFRVDVANDRAVKNFLTGVDAFLSAVPYYFNVRVTKAAIAAKASMCDLGGNTEVVFQQLKLNAAAKKAGIAVVPDCGLCPGMGNTLAVYGMEHFDRPRAVRVRVGGLPQRRHPPLDYFLSFNIAGLSNEYFGKAYVLRNGKVTKIDTFSELETLEFPEPVGMCEAFVTTGGTSTCPWTFAAKLEEYEEKTVRYPGHYEKFKTMLELGLLDEKPVKVGSVKVSPREVFHAVVGPQLTVDEPRDVVVLRVAVSGEKAGRQARMILEIMDFFDDDTRFTAMQRTTGFPAAMVAEMMARGEVAKGAICLETAVDARTFVKALPLRGIKLHERFEYNVTA
jgi:lysine 6-dehydrogenase